MMAQPLFLAETPRAGPYGHRILLPAGASLKGAQIENYLRLAAMNDEGRDYIAASRLVEQRLPGGSVRRGNETVVLVGIDLARLETAQKEALRRLTAKRLTDLEQLVDFIDWERDGKNTFVYRDELKRWMIENHLENLPVCYFMERSRRRAIIGGAVAGLVTGLGILYYLSR